ncbi:glycosyltransferase [Paenibacillus sp. CF384]|uniref:glycosyltransferase n=1 Tax=Paenibacillus sp. CF384 TaxID=1884382 RepID=UPI00089796D5|nr:glycosyltransferase [Paenibacillus sp. CF384]SDX65700.1 Glycosyltransferase involved in cell wall bisynthesis [Paenibacillus sp. CF384]
MAVDKYLFVTNSLSSGGAERVVSILASGIAERGYEVHLILYERVQHEYPISDKVHIHLLPKNKGESRIKYFAKKLAAMRRTIREVDPHIIIPFLPDQVNHFFVASRFMNIPFVSTVRNNPFQYPDSKRKRAVGKIVALCSTGIMLQTEEQAGFFPKFAKRKTLVVPNPVSNELIDSHYPKRDSIQEIATFGRLNTQKNQELLIEAFAVAYETNPTLRLSLYGAGEEADNLKDLVKKRGIQDAVTFRGRVSNVAEALVSTDLFVLSSNYEGMPNALMEAMAVGLPCISTDCPTGPSDLINNMSDGILVRRNNVSELAAAINYCVTNPAFCNEAGKAAKKKMKEEYQVDIIIDKFIREINGIKGCS